MSFLLLHYTIGIVKVKGSALIIPRKNPARPRRTERGITRKEVTQINSIELTYTRANPLELVSRINFILEVGRVIMFYSHESFADTFNLAGSNLAIVFKFDAIIDQHIFGINYESHFVFLSKE
jgi:hypothetical protein